MTVSNWWEAVDFYMSDASVSIIPTVYFVIRCKDCGAEYETGTLQVVPLECPDCGKKSEVRDD